MPEPTPSAGAGGFSQAFRSRLVRYPLYTIAGVVVVLGIIGGFTTALDATNSIEFCTSCHDMRYNLEEYKKTIHYSNPAGVRAVCSDCHVPKRNWFKEMQRKLIAGKDVWGEIVGVIDTREKFDAHRRAMAEDEWARMRESDSIGCRNCHSFDSMDLTGQDKMAAKKHARVIAGDSKDKTCIDCHKGIAHHLPSVD
jgi:cytochrome c-type protein NapC